MAGLPHEADVFPRIVVENHANVQLSLIVLLNGFDSGDFSLEGEIENISPGAWAQLNAITATNLNAVDLERLDWILVFKELPFPFVHGVSPFMVRSPRTAP
jgi:hypothetical protein